MSLKKYLIRQNVSSGQVFMEYVLILVALASLTILASSGFFGGFRQTMNHFENVSVTKMDTANTPDSGMAEVPDPEPPPKNRTGIFDFGGGW